MKYKLIYLCFLRSGTSGDEDPSIDKSPKTKPLEELIASILGSSLELICYNEFLRLSTHHSYLFASINAIKARGNFSEEHLSKILEIID